MKKLNKMYYQEMYERYDIKYLKGKINLVTAPCGAGKSYHCQYLIEKYDREDKDCYYVTDTNMLKETVKNSLPKCVRVITYQVLGMILSDSKQREKFLKNTELLILDELHQLYRFARRYNGEEISETERYYEYAKVELFFLPKYMKVLALSGTPGDFKYDIKDDSVKKQMVNEVLTTDMIKLLHCQEREEDKMIVNMADYLINSFELDKGKKALGYTNAIRDLKTYRDILELRGYNVGILWSKNNKDYDLTDEQLELYEYIKEYNKLPDNIDVLLINAGYESGWNLENEGSTNVQTVFINTSDNVTITQVVNRVRHDIELLVHTMPKLKESDFYDYDWTRRQIKKIDTVLSLWWYRGLLESKRERDQLCDKLCLLDTRRRKMKQLNAICNHMHKLNLAYYYHNTNKNKDMTIDDFYNDIFKDNFDGENIFNYEILEHEQYYDKKQKKTIKGAWLVHSFNNGIYEYDIDDEQQPKTTHEKVQELQAQGMTQKQVMEKLKLGRTTVVKYWKAK